MAKLFDIDNPVWRFMGRLADAFLLTALWAACSLPIVTVGASTTSLYYVALKMAEGQEGYLIRGFFRSFRENFAHSTLVWLVMLAVGIFLGWNLYQCYRLPTRAGALMFWVFAVPAVVYLFVLTMIFPLAARLDISVQKLIFMAFMVSMKHASWVMLMVVLTACGVAIGVFVFWPILLFLAGGIAYVNSYILTKTIFARYGWTS